MSEAPFWFDRALATPSEPGDVTVDGVNIHFETWGEVGNPGIALIHGSNAHLEWWRFVAPFLADQFRVVALDSSGNGDSGWREKYTGKVLADEVAAVIDAAELGVRPAVVGHSFGGFTVLEAGHYHGHGFSGIVFMDFTTAPPEQYVEWGLRAERDGVTPGRKTRVYEDKATALGRFRYVPEQPVKVPEVLAYIAEKSLRQVEGGWTWKFDPGLFDYLEMGVDQRDKFAALPCRTAVILGEESNDEGAFYADHMAEITGGKMPIFKIPGTYHHLTFDEPLAVAMALKGLCLDWIRQDNEALIKEQLAGVLNP
ncbi:MAG: alpha/beta hydrolase [Pseudomonadota bacterium]